MDRFCLIDLDNDLLAACQQIVPIDIAVSDDIALSRSSSEKRLSIDTCSDQKCAAQTPGLNHGEKPRAEGTSLLCIGALYRRAARYGGPVAEVAPQGAARGVRGLNTIIARVCEEKEVEIVATEVMPDRVHPPVDCDPQFAIHRLVRLIKGCSSHALRREFPPLRSRLRLPASPSAATGDDITGQAYWRYRNRPRQQQGW
jgi:hypothetical protein